jgi:hypothetical protein
MLVFQSLSRRKPRRTTKCLPIANGLDLCAFSVTQFGEGIDKLVSSSAPFFDISFEDHRSFAQGVGAFEDEREPDIGIRELVTRVVNVRPSCDQFVVFANDAKVPSIFESGIEDLRRPSESCIKALGRFCHRRV